MSCLLLSKCRVINNHANMFLRILQPLNNPRWFTPVSDKQNFKPPPPFTFKRPLSPYFEFLADKRTELKEANPGMKLVELVRTAGNLWRHLPDEQKEAYKKKAEVQKQDYVKKYKEYIESLSSEEKQDVLKQKEKLAENRKIHRINLKKRRHKMELKRLEKPKRNPTAFALYVKAQQLERGDAPITQYVKGLAEHWKKMPEEDKTIYYDEAHKLRLVYETQLAKWEQKMIEEGKPQLTSRYKEEKPRKKSTAKPSKKASSSVSKTKTRAKASKTKARSSASKSKAEASSSSNKTKDSSSKSSSTKTSSAKSSSEKLNSGAEHETKKKMQSKKPSPDEIAKEGKWMREE